MKVTIKKISPKEAEMLLFEHNPYNYRKINFSTVKIYAKDMKDGNWKENGETIKFDFNGNLIDGQHRLQAIVESGITIELIIVEGLDPNVADTIDIGRKRTIEQYLKWADKAYTAGATSIVQQVLSFDKQNKQDGHSAADAGISQMSIMDEYVNDKNGYNEAAAYGKKVNSESQKVLKPKEVGGMYYYLHRRLGVDKEYIQMFFHRLCSASYNEKSFYKKTMKNLGDKEYIRRSGVTRTNELIECWNAMVHGCSTNRVHYSDWFEKPLARRSDTEFATAAL
jgi:hypothetical protein